MQRRSAIILGSLLTAVALAVFMLPGGDDRLPAEVGGPSASSSSAGASSAPLCCAPPNPAAECATDADCACGMHCGIGVIPGDCYCGGNGEWVCDNTSGTLPNPYRPVCLPNDQRACTMPDPSLPCTGNADCAAGYVCQPG